MATAAASRTCGYCCRNLLPRLLMLVEETTCRQWIMWRLGAINLMCKCSHESMNHACLFLSLCCSSVQYMGPYICHSVIYIYGCSKKNKVQQRDDTIIQKDIYEKGFYLLRKLQPFPLLWSSCPSQLSSLKYQGKDAQLKRARN